MRNSERGASQVPFVICLVLLLVAGFLYYDESTKRTTVEETLSRIRSAAMEEGQAAQPSVETIRDLINAGKKVPSAKTHLNELVNETGFVNDENPDLVISTQKIQTARDNLLNELDKGEFTVEFPVDRFIDPGDKEGVKVIKGEGKYTVSYAGTRELRGARPTIESVFNTVLVPGYRRMVADIKRYRDAYVQAMSQKEAAEAAFRETLAQKDKEIADKVSALASLEASKANEISQLRNERDDALSAKQAAEEELAREKAALTAELAKANRRVEEKSTEVQVLKQRRRAIETDTSPDGSILAVGVDQRSVVIDIGRKNNNLIAGTNFDVYGIGKGGQRVPKGTIKVVKVDADTAQATVTSHLDRYEPMIPGDKVLSLTYDPNEVIHVALVGRFTRMGRSDAARRLEALGVVVDDAVGVGTSYLVVGSPESDTEPIEETEAYKKAQLYGVPTISENELSRFTMY